MWLALLLAASLVPQQPAPSRTVVTPTFSIDITLAAPVQFPDGRLAGATVKVVPSETPWFVYSQGNLCRSIIARTAPAEASDGWRVTIAERARSTTHVTLGVSWQRLWERGRPTTTGSSGTSELTLQGGDRVGLDQIVRPSSPGICAATGKALELRVSRSVNPATMAPAVTDAALDGPVVAELWMVHRAPNGTETMDRQEVQLLAGGVGFVFRSRPIETAEGPMVVDLTGQLRAVQRADGTRGLSVGLTRAFTQVATGQLRFSGSGGGKTLDWLAPDDVISLDIPGPSAAGAGGAFGSVGGGIGGGTGGGGARSGGVAAGGTISARSGSAGTPPATARAGGGGAGGAMISSAGAESLARLAAALSGHQISLRLRLLQ
jgi:hypothetical protein